MCHYVKLHACLRQLNVFLNIPRRELFDKFSISPDIPEVSRPGQIRRRLHAFVHALLALYP